MHFSHQYITTFLLRHTEILVQLPSDCFFPMSESILNITSGHFADIKNLSHQKLVVTTETTKFCLDCHAAINKTEEATTWTAWLSFLKGPSLKITSKKENCKERIRV